MSCALTTVADLPSERRPEPDVPPPPPGIWPLAAGAGPSVRATIGLQGGPAAGRPLDAPPLVGVGLSLVAIALYLAPLPEWADPIKVVAMGIALVLTVATGIDYAVRARRWSRPAR